MKPKINSIKRGGAFALVEIMILVAIIGLFAVLAIPKLQAGNYTGYYVNTTNVIITAANTNAANVVAAAATNTFNLSITAGNTNDPTIWPACPLQIQESMFYPSRFLTLQQQHQSMAANTGNYTERYAASVDGTHWQTNPCPLIVVYTEAGTGGVQILTNLDSGAIQYYCLFKRENTNASVAITNLFLGTGFDRGL